MLLLLLGMIALVFVASLVLMQALAWAVVLAVVALVGGAVLGLSADLDELDA